MSEARSGQLLEVGLQTLERDYLVGIIFNVFICVFFFFLVNVAEEYIFNSLDAYSPVLVQNKLNAFLDLQLQNISHSEFHSCTCRSRQLNLMKPHFPPRRAFKFSSCWVLCNRFQSEDSVPFGTLLSKTVCHLFNIGFY